mgnify:CR=1 FL=1
MNLSDRGYQGRTDTVNGYISDNVYSPQFRAGGDYVDGMLFDEGNHYQELSSLSRVVLSVGVMCADNRRG